RERDQGPESVISSWQGDRRIGRASTHTRLQDWLKLPLASLGICVAVATALVLLNSFLGIFSDFQTLQASILLWSIGCVTGGAVSALEFLRTRRWTQAAATLALTLAVAVLFAQF